MARTTRAPRDGSGRTAAPDEPASPPRPPVDLTYAALPPLFFAALLFLQGALGPRAPEFDHLAGLACLAGCAALVLSSLGRGALQAPPRTLAAAATLLLGGLGLAAFGADPSAWGLGAAGGLALLASGRAPAGASFLARLAAGVLAVALWDLCTRLLAAPWLLEHGLARGLARIVTGLAGESLQLGPSASGWTVALTAFLLLLPLGLARSWRRTGWVLAAPWLVLVLALATAARLGGAGHDHAAGAGHGEAPLEAALLGRLLGDQAWVQALLLLGFALLARRRPVPDRGPSPLARRLVLAAGVLAALALAEVRWIGRASLRAPEPGRCIVLSNEVRPPHPEGHYHGLLWQRVQEWGFELTWASGLEELDEPAGPGDVITLVFPISARAPDEAPGVLAAVERGAGLLVVGEHTDVLGCRTLLAPLADPLGTAPRFDSAFPVGWPWSEVASLGAHPLREAWRRSARPHYRVGASLDVPWRGRVLLDARYAFGDLGDRDGIPGNYIGDRSFGPEDALGDLPLVVTTERGRGRVLVAGDPEFLLNDSLPWSEELAEHLFAYLADPAPAFLDRAAGLFALCTLLLVLLVGALRSPELAPWPALALALALGLPAPYVQRPFERSAVPGSGAEPRLLIDLAHHPALSFETSSGRGIEGLVNELRRQGTWPVLAGALEPERLEDASAVLLVAPHSALSEDEAERLLAFVGEGGTLILAVGFHHAAAVEPILRAAGIEVLPRLVGRGTNWRDDLLGDAGEGLFREAYALRFPQGSPAVPVHRIGGPGGEVVVAEARLGPPGPSPAGGRVVVLSDPLFLLGGNLGIEGYSFGGNRRLFSRILRGT